MTEDNKTILANLAITIAEKEEDIKRLTNRIQVLTDQCNELDRKRKLPTVMVTSKERQTLGDLLKPGMLTFKSYEDLETELSGVKEELEKCREMYSLALGSLEDLKHLYENAEKKRLALQESIDSDQWFSIVKVLNKWRKHKIKSGKVFKENMRNRVRHEYDDQIRDLTLKLNAAKRSSAQDRERFNELNANYRQLSSAFYQRLKEKQSHRFQMDGEWLEMTTQELIDFYVSCHPHKVTEGMGMYRMEIPACKTCAYKFPPTEE